MTQRSRFNEREGPGAPAGEHHEIVDEGPAPGEDIVAELNEEQEQLSDAPLPQDGAAKLARALEDQRDRYLRLAAEFENFRKRTSKERMEAGGRAQAELAAALLEPLDDLARFIGAGTVSADVNTLVQGVELVTRKLMKSLSLAGLEVVDPQDQPFDPAVHEAVSTQPALTPDEDEMIAMVFQPGYLFKGQLLRPARVVVKKWNG